METKSCSNCKFLAFKSVGYSNYTVEDTELICLKNVFDSVDESDIRKYDGSLEDRVEAFFVKHASECDIFIDLPKGIYQVSLDVDGETTIEDFQQDPEIYEAAKAYFN